MITRPHEERGRSDQNIYLYSPLITLTILQTPTMDMEPVIEVVVEPPPIPVVPVMDTILEWIGFDQEATRNRLQAEGFESFEDVLAMKEKDVRDLAESYGRRTLADGRAIFGLRRVCYLIGLIHWNQDFQRTGESPTIEGIADAAQFRTALDEASIRADVRKVEKEQSDTVSKAADPGKFKDKRKVAPVGASVCKLLINNPRCKRHPTIVLRYS